MSHLIHGDREYRGRVTFVGTMSTIPAGTFTGADFAAAADVYHEKIEHRRPVVYAQADGSDIVSATQLLHTCYFSGTIVDVTAVCDQVVSGGGDYLVEVDVKKSTAGGAFATVLSAPIRWNSNGYTGTDRTPKTGTISGAALAAGDILEVVVTVTGSTGTMAQGLNLTVTIAENSIK